MFRILTFTDVHLSDRNPVSRKDNYRQTMLNKLEQVRDIALDRQVDLVLCGGDIFHIKTPSRNSHYLVSQTIDIFKSFPCPIYSVYGNHDISQDNINNLPRQPFYTLMKSGAVRHLIDEKFYDNRVRVFGINYLNDPEYEDFNRENDGESVQICVAHVNASCKFDDLFGERVYTYQKLKETSPDIFVFGHYHPDQGIEYMNGKYFINVGSLSRASLKKDEIGRTPSLGYIEIDEELLGKMHVKCEKLPLNVLSAESVFDLEKKEQEDEEQRETEKFVKELKDKMFSRKADNIVDEVKKLSFENKIKTRALDYLERV